MQYSTPPIERSLTRYEPNGSSGHFALAVGSGLLVTFALGVLSNNAFLAIIGGLVTLVFVNYRDTPATFVEGTRPDHV